MKAEAVGEEGFVLVIGGFLLLLVSLDGLDELLLGGLVGGLHVVGGGRGFVVGTS